ALLADHVAHVVLVHAQLELAAVPRLEDLHRHVLGMIDQALRHGDDQVAEAEIVLVGLARLARGGRTRRADHFGWAGAPFGAIGTDDNRSPLQHSRIVDRPHRRTVGSGRLRCSILNPATQRAAPLAHTSSTVLFGHFRTLASRWLVWSLPPW